MKLVVDKFHVVNEAAERGVKLCYDFLEAAKTENRFQQILQVVENNRFCVPNQRNRSSLSNQKSWFLTLEK